MSDKEITEDELCSFLISLKPKLNEELKITSKTEKTWDTLARHKIGKNMEKWVKGHFPTKKFVPWKNYFSYEGKNDAIPRAKIFSSYGCHPDLYFLKPVKIAIELDHGKTGSKLKNAIAKAGFDYLSGDWKKVFVVFIDESNNKQITNSLDEEASKKALNFYKEQLKTEVIVV